MTGRLPGIILMAVGVILFIAVAAFLLVGSSAGQLGSGGLALGLVLMIIIVLPIISVGVVLYVRGGREAVEMARVSQERKLLSIVTARGSVGIADVALEMNASRDDVKAYLYDLVGKGLFSGYVNWQEGKLISQQAREMPRDKCPNCGGQLELAGKGVVQCPYCGSEIFLSA